MHGFAGLLDEDARLCSLSVFDAFRLLQELVDAPEPKSCGWIRAIDEAMVTHHLGVADIVDDYEAAKKKLNTLLSLNQDIGEYFSAKAPEPEPVARVTGYYGGYLSIETVDGRVLPAGTALYAAPPHQAEHHLEMVRDAERYRWLRNDGAGFDISVAEIDDDGHESWVHGYPPEELDTAIDAAIAAEKGGKGK